MHEHTEQEIRGNALGAAREANHQLTELLKRCQPEEVISRVALYICTGLADLPEPERPDRNETHLEYLVSLATAFPYPSEARPPTPDDIQSAIELLTKIHQAVSAYHLFSGKSANITNEPMDDIARSFRLDRLHVRGDAFWPHLRKTTSDLLAPHDTQLKASLGFESSDFFHLFDRAEDNLSERFHAEHREMSEPYLTMLKPWRKVMASPETCAPEESARFRKFCEKNDEALTHARQSFDEFGTPSLFAIEAASPAEAAILKALACSFGDNREFHGKKPEHAFWPLTESRTENQPIISHGGRLFAFLLPKIQRETYELISRMLRRATPDYWDAKFRPWRDTYLEQETARLFQQALPTATVVTGALYPFGANDAETEADIVVVCDDFLLIVECKAGAIAPATKRGGARSAESDLRKTIVGAHDQAERLVCELESRGELKLRSNHNRTETIIRAKNFRRVVRVSVTLELMSAASTSLWMLGDGGKLKHAERCWSVALNDLRVVVDILDSPTIFLHYITRRLDLNAVRKVHARDELDYLMHYVERGLFFREQNAPGNSETVMIANWTQDLEQYYRRVAGISQFGKKPKPKIPGKVRRFIAMLETLRPQNYVSACLAFLDLDRPEQVELLGKLPEHLALLRKDKTAAYGLSFCANLESKSGVVLATARQPEKVREAIFGRTIAHCQNESLTELCVILQSVPFGSPPVFVLLAHPNDSISEGGMRLLQQLHFEMRERRQVVANPRNEGVGDESG